MKAKLILAGFIGALLCIFFWLATHSFVEITIQNPTDNLTYNLLDQRSERVASAQNAPAKIKRLVRRGSHQLTVWNDDESAFSLVKAGGFLGTTSVSVRLQPAHHREFVGNNPGNCLYPVDNRLLSIICGDTYDRLQVHQPATTSQPTLSAKANGKIFGLIEGVVRTKEGSVMLVKASAIEGQQTAHTAYLLQPDGNVTKPTPLSDLSTNKEYALKPYKDGFLAYDTVSGTVFAYESLGAEPTRIAAAKPKARDQAFSAVETYDATMAHIYTNTPDVVAPDVDHGEGISAHSEEFEEAATQDKKSKSEVAVRRNGQTVFYGFRKPAYGLRLCGKDLICALENGIMEVFDVSGQKAKLLYKVYGVVTIQNLPEGLLLVRPTDVLLFDVQERRGLVSYDLGNYSFCGIGVGQKGYDLCVLSPGEKRFGLRIKLDQTKADDIDQDLLRLEALTQVETISVYGSFIHILQNVGNPRLDRATGSYEYPQDKIDSTTATINGQLDRLGIDRSVYTVIYALR